MVIEQNSKALLTGICTVSCGIVLGWFLKSWHKGGTKKEYEETDEKDITKKTFEESFSDFVSGDHKLVLVVQNGLKMGKGKIAAQCAHASVTAYKSSLKHNSGSLKKWINSGQRKVVVKVDDEKSLLEIAQNASKVGLTVSLICDAGRTQIPSGSKTVLGVGPGPENLIDAVTGHLKLL